MLILVVAGLYALPNYHILLTPGSLLAKSLVHPSLLFIGFAGLIYLFRSLPKASELPGPDLSRGWAYLWFAFFFAVCAATRFYHPEEFPPYYFVDQLMGTSDILNIVDFHQYPLIFPFGSRPPFFPYLTAGLWELFPHASGFWINRLSSTVIDLGVIWGLYLLGRTIHGRRMGLILMSLWAFSMPGIIWAYSGYGLSSSILVSIFALIFFFRLLQKPDLKHFIYWGISLAVGDYCYQPFRPWPPTLITLVLLWALFGSKEKLKGMAPKVLAVTLWLSWAFLFFYKNGFLPQGRLSDLISHPVFLVILALVLAAAYFKTWQAAGEGETNRRVFGWATGAGVTALIMAPLLLHPLYSSYTTYISLFHENGKMVVGMETFKALWANIVYFFQAMFATTEPDFARYPIFGHSFYESCSVIAMVVGLAYFIARPSWRKAVVLLMMVVGMMPFIMCQRTHTGRAFGTVAPLLMMGAWGLDAYWGLITREVKNLFARWLFFLLIACFWVWDAHCTFALSRDYMVYRTTNDAVIGGQLDKDWKDYRLIIVRHLPDFAGPNFTMLCDQKDVWFLENPNPLYLEAGEKSKDVLLYVYGGDEAMQNKVREDFPQAQWTGVSSLNGPGFIRRALIPFDSLQETPGKLVYIQRVPHDYWRRRYYWAEYPYGLARGVVGWDDRVPDLKAPFPPGMNEQVTARVDGEMTAPVSGEYIFHTNLWGETMVLTVDGKRVDLEREQDARRGSLRLEAGVHKVTILTSFKTSYTQFQDIIVIPPAGGKEWVLGQPALNNKP